MVSVNLLLMIFVLGYIASWALTLAFDTLVFVLTFAKTIRLALAARRLKIQNSLVLLMLRDGE